MKTVLTKTGFEQCVGNTPLLYLKSISKIAGCHVFGKAEFLNPCGSLKDRTALSILLDAEKSGKLKRGQNTYVVEGTTGNTGISLTVLATTFGYKPVIVIPKSTVLEKKLRLINYGAKLIQVNDCEATNPNHFHSFAQRLTENLNKSGLNAFYCDQHNNLSNYNIHNTTTAIEIYDDMTNKFNLPINIFSCSMGTAGTLIGVSKYLKSKDVNTKICLTDPYSGYLVNYFNNGELRLSENAKTICEGTPGTRAMVNQQIKNTNFIPDYATEINDSDMLNALYTLKTYEGLLCGFSTGINVAGTINVAKKFNLRNNDTVVTILCDSADQYASRIFNTQFLKKEKLPIPHWLNDQDDNDNHNNDVIHPFQSNSEISTCIHTTLI